MTLGETVDDLYRWGSDAVMVGRSSLKGSRVIQLSVLKGGRTRRRNLELIPGTINEVEREAVERLKHSFEEV